MSIGYVIQKRRIAVGTTPGIKFVARIFREKFITQEKIAKNIADQSSLSMGDVYNVFQCLKEEIAKNLSEGKGVKLDLLGTFSPSIKAIAKDTMEEVKSTTIENVYVNFLPSRELIEAIRAAGVEYIDTNITGIQYRNTLEVELGVVNDDQEVAKKETKTPANVKKE